MNIIQIKNDQVRKSLPFVFVPNKLMITRSLIAVFGPDQIQQIIDMVKNFNSFTEENDPYGEHDFGTFEFQNETINFKFDYVDSNYEYFEENGNRILTVGLASDF